MLGINPDVERVAAIALAIYGLGALVAPRKVRPLPSGMVPAVVAMGAALYALYDADATLAAQSHAMGAALYALDATLAAQSHAIVPTPTP